MKQIHIALMGATGRMGQEIQSVIKQDSRFAIPTLISRQGPIKTIGEIKTSVDVVVDFSLPQALLEVVQWCKMQGKPLVSGVTGLTESQMGELKTLAQSVAVLWSPNLSLGIAMLKAIVGSMPLLESAEYQIEEFHHSKKKDNPSGTAVLLQKELEKRAGKTLPPPVGIRGGGIIGIHRVHVMAQEETLCFEHQALSRAVFARGALTAAKWILTQKPGLYSIEDVVRS